MAEEVILIIEDNVTNQKIMRDLLMVHKFKTLTASDGPTGLEMARTHRPDLILMDIQLPGMDGYAVTELLKADESTKQIPVVAVTSFAMQAEKARATEGGCDGYITKPIDIHQVIATVKSFLDVT